MSSALTALGGILFVNLSAGEKTLETSITSSYGVDDEGFARTVGTLFGPALLPGNAVTPLQNGAEIFPAMLEAIKHARKSITFETYIYWSGRVGTDFAEALAERAKAGVRTHLILDAVGGGRIDDRAIALMKEGGVEIERYHPLRWYNIDRINNRTHRKLLVVDGEVGFTGGVGIADKWDGRGDAPEHWRDSHFKLEGPAVAEMQATFVDHWLATRGTLLSGPAYFPPLAAKGHGYAQIVRSSVEDGAEAIHLMYLLSIAAARRSVLLTNSYFVPDAWAIEALVAAKRRGVDVQMLVPGPIIDTEVTRAASRHLWGPLLEAGIPLYEFQPTMLHEKVMVVDDVWSSVGSTNFDNRSFRLNDEANLNVMDRELAQGLRKVFEQDRGRAHRVTLDEWRNRSGWQRLKEWLAARLRKQL